MPTYDQRIRKYQREITKLGKEYETPQLSRAVNYLIGDSNIARKVDNKEFDTAMRKGPKGLKAYLRENQTFFKDIISYGMKAGKLAYGEIEDLNKQADKLNAKIGGLEKKVKKLDAKIKKDAPLLKKARAYKAKADVLDACAQAAKGYHIPTLPKLSGHAMK